jgi:hypothetical protein
MFQQNCLYCGKYREAIPLVSWDNPEHISYYCFDHYEGAANFNDQQKRDFIKHYEDERIRKWLNPKQLALYHRLTNKKPE